ncbi:MAG: pyrroline-5-carboxylate reductase dimerization domain-containing protein, partial [Rikenellaceae bacterium]
VITEAQMTPLTSLSSCGIAFAYKYIDASIEGGVEVGIDQDLARRVVLQTVRGALMMLETNGTMPQTEIDKVTTKGGITLKGLEAMAREGFTNAVKVGVKESR